MFIDHLDRSHRKQQSCHIKLNSMPTRSSSTELMIIFEPANNTHVITSVTLHLKIMVHYDPLVMDLESHNSI